MGNVPKEKQVLRWPEPGSFLGFHSLKTWDPKSLSCIFKLWKAARLSL